MIKAAAGWQTNVAGRKGSYEGVFVGAYKVCSIKSCEKFVEDSIAESPFSSIQHCLKGGYRKFVYSFIGPVGHNIWWENSRNASFGPKKCPKTQK